MVLPLQDKRISALLQGNDITARELLELGYDEAYIFEFSSGNLSTGKVNVHHHIMW